MKVIRAAWILLLFLPGLPGALLPAEAQQSRARVSTENESISAFLPLQQWKAAVLSGDGSALAAFYIIPPAETKAAEGDPARDPSAEPAFWSSLRNAGLIRFDVKVLEVKNLQPGAKAFVLRFEFKFRTGTVEKSQVISGSQVWIQRDGNWRILSTRRGDLAAAVPRRLPEPAVPNVQLYPNPEQASSDLAAALGAAARDHKRVLLVFGGNWCYDCHVLDAAFHSKEMAPLISRNYHVVHINVGEFNRNTDLADRYEIPLEKGVPSVAVLDPEGRLLVSQRQGEFESTTQIGPEDVIQFLQRWKPEH